MNDFLLFAGDKYYPSGGWHDFKGAYPTLEAALTAAATPPAWSSYGWWHIVHFGEIVASRSE